MRAVLQRVQRAEVRVETEIVGQIQTGICVLLGVLDGDTEQDATYLAKKIAACRIFSDAADKMNLCVRDIDGAVLAISQFTLAADCKKGNRPSFVRAMQPDEARLLFEFFCRELRAQGVHVETGQFRAHMEVELINDGPVTIVLDSR